MAKKPTPRKHQAASPAGKAASRKTVSGTQTGIFSGISPGWLIFFGINALLFLFTRLQLLAIPFERDEGSFAYIGHWLLRGKELYTDMLDSKLPGLYVYYGVFMSLFGYGPVGAHTGLLFANLVSALCFFLFLKRAFNPQVAVISCSLYLWMVVSPNVLGFAAHATQLLTPFVLAGILFFWNGLHRAKLYLFFLSGLMIGIAFTIKQQSAIYGIMMAILWWPARLAWNKVKDRPLPVLEWIVLGIGGFLPAAAVIFYFLAVGRFDAFLEWTVYKPINLAGSFQDPWYKMFFRFVPTVIEHMLFIWLTAAAGLVLVFFSGFKTFARVFAPLFTVLSLLSVIIGAAYYTHYFVLTIPGIALLAAISIDWIGKKTGSMGTAVAMVMTAFLILMTFQGRTDYYFQPDYYKIHFRQYAQNMFPELERLGKDLAKRVPEGQKIAVMGSEPELLVAADRESCSKHLMVYSLLIDPVKSPPMQQEYIQELQSCNPEYIVWATGTGSWAPGYDRLQFFETLISWVEQNYEIVGLAESRDDRPGVIVWDEALRAHQPQNNYQIQVLKRRAPAGN